MYGGGHLVQTRSCTLRLCWKTLVVIKSFGFIRGRSIEEASCEDLERVIIDNDLEKFFQVGVQLPPHEKQALVEFLWENVDVFAWDAYETLGTNLVFICHHLNVNPSIILRKQPPRRSSKDHYEAVKDEITKLK